MIAYIIYEVKLIVSIHLIDRNDRSCAYGIQTFKHFYDNCKAAKLFESSRGAWVCTILHLLTDTVTGAGAKGETI
jgi:hypothetical protein